MQPLMLLIMKEVKVMNDLYIELDAEIGLKVELTEESNLEVTLTEIE